MTNLGYTPEEPVAAIATALAPGAIGIVRTSGTDCIKKISAMFSRPKALQEAPGNTMVYGWIINPETKEKIDEVMLGIYRGPKSFTGEDMVEIFCHGGVSVVTGIHSLLLKNGFRQAERGEYTFRAYINGKSDLTKAEAIKEIIDSKTDVSRSRAAGRLSGSLYSEIDSIKKLIIDTLAAIEVEIEYPEDEETISETFNESDLICARDRLKVLVDSWKCEKLYQDGARVVLCGKTNAGKSSLFNVLLKEERAIVSDIEGTTRDYLESWASFDGVPVRLFDTAGLRKTDDVIEAVGVERANDLSRDADVILYLVDSSAGLSKEDAEFIEDKLSAAENIPLVLVANKCEKKAEGFAEDLSVLPEAFDSSNIVYVSAKSGAGIDELTLKVKKLLGGTEDSREQAGLGSARQKKAVEEALERVEHSLEAVRDNYTLDAVVQDLEDSLDSLGEVTGDVTPDDVLGSIFSHFCVGK